MHRHRKEKISVKNLHKEDRTVLRDKIVHRIQNQQPQELKNLHKKKGVWHVLPDYIADHGTVIGGSLSYIGPGRAEPYRKYWRDHLDMLMGLED